jgi:uncharacterized membrane protein
MAAVLIVSPIEILRPLFDAGRGCQCQRHQTQMRMTMPQWWWARMEWRNSHSTTSERSFRWLLVSIRNLRGWCTTTSFCEQHEAVAHCHNAAYTTGEQEKATARLEEVHASTLRHAAAARKQRDSSAAANGADALDVASEVPEGADGKAAEGDGVDVGPPR